MTKFLSLVMLCLFFVACNKTDPAADCQQTTTSATGDTTATQCTATGDTTGGTTGTTTGDTTGGTTTGGTTTGGTTTGGTTTGGTTTGGTTTGGTTTGGTTTGGTTTGGKTTGGTTTGGTTTGGTTTGGTTTGGSSLPNAALTFDTNVSFYNTTADEEAKFQKALEIIKDVVATEEFRSKVLNHTYNGTKTFVDNGGFTNAQIYQKILDGAETLQNTKDNQMDMEVELYYTDNSTVGYTYSNVKRIWVNTKFFKGYTAAGVAHNLFHEWLHKLGFGHASTYSTSRDYSVPYAIGNIVGDIGKDFL